MDEGDSSGYKVNASRKEDKMRRNEAKVCTMYDYMDYNIFMGVYLFPYADQIVGPLWVAGATWSPVELGNLGKLEAVPWWRGFWVGVRSAVGRRLSSTLLLSRGIRNAEGTAPEQPNPCSWRG